MSLLDPIAVCEAVLETVMTQEIVLANRSDCPADALFGAGTMLNPYNAMGSAGASDPPFDKIMRSLGAGKTVRMLPGTYYTRGFPDSGSIGWRPPSRLRLIGSGMRNTTLKRCTAIVSGAHAVIGNDFSNYSQFIDGLEITDLCIDANHVEPPGQIIPSISGIAISGRNFLIKRVRVMNFGNNTGSVEPCFGISVARVPSLTPPDLLAENCTVAECVVDTPGANATGPLSAIDLRSEYEGSYHQFCSVRNCFVDLNQGPGTFPKDYIGISVGGGIGTIVEYNRFINCKYGVRLPNLLSTSDLTVRHNYMRQMPIGISLTMKDAIGNENVGRVLILNNVIEWPKLGDYAPETKGISIEGKSAASFKNVVIRDNVIRRFDNSVSNSDYGIWLTHLTNTLITSNIINVGDVTRSVYVPNTVTRPKPFNNSNRQGTLLRAFNPDTSTLIPELSTVLQDVDMAFFRQ